MIFVWKKPKINDKRGWRCPILKNKALKSLPKRGPIKRSLERVRCEVNGPLIVTIGVFSSRSVDDGNALPDGQEVVGDEGYPLSLWDELVAHAEALLVADQLISQRRLSYA